VPTGVGTKSNPSDTVVGDATAYDITLPEEIKRTRSLHSSDSRITKGDSTVTSKKKGEILPGKGEFENESTVHRVLKEALTKFMDKDRKYNGLARLISPQLLKTSYYLIKSNPGNMSPGATPETLDGIKDL